MNDYFYIPRYEDLHIEDVCVDIIKASSAPARLEIRFTSSYYTDEYLREISYLSANTKPLTICLLGRAYESYIENFREVSESATVVGTLNKTLYINLVTLL